MSPQTDRRNGHDSIDTSTDSAPEEQAQEAGEENTRRHINESQGVTIVGKAKMGSGTRDQAEVKLKGKGGDAEEAAEEFEAALEAAEEGDWGHRLLDLNPER